MKEKGSGSCTGSGYDLRLVPEARRSDATLCILLHEWTTPLITLADMRVCGYAYHNCFE